MHKKDRVKCLIALDADVVRDLQAIRAVYGLTLAEFARRAIAHELERYRTLKELPAAPGRGSRRPITA